MSTRIVCTASHFPLSYVIRYLTSSPVSHSMLQDPCELWGIDEIAEASVTGVIKIPAYKVRKHVVADFECLFDTKEAHRQIAKYLGDTYDVEGLFVYLWVKALYRLFRCKVRKPLNNTKGQFCSELIARFFMAAKLPGTESWDPELISPKDIAIYCLRHPELFKVVTATKKVLALAT